VVDDVEEKKLGKFKQFYFSSYEPKPINLLQQ
jgi:hypothetical protein